MTRKQRVVAEHKLDDDVDDVLIKVVENQEGDSSVGLSTVLEHQWSQELELADRIVCGSCSLLSLFALNSNTHVSLLDHVNVVCSITYGKSNFVGETVSYHQYYLSFLLRGDSAGQDDIGFISNFQK